MFEKWASPTGKGAGIFADGLIQAVDSGLDNVQHLN